MQGSSTAVQALLPVKTGDVVQRNSLLKRSEQSFAAVFEKKIQVRQEKTDSTQSSVGLRERQTQVTDRREDERPVEKTEKAEKPEKPLAKNPAKEKMKELLKKVKDTLKAMDDLEAKPENAGELKTLIENLQNLINEIKVLSEETSSQLPEGFKPGTDQQEVMNLIAGMGGKYPTTEAVAATDETPAQGTTAAIFKPEHWDNRQTPEVKGNPLLKALEKVIEAQSALIADNPELKDAFAQVLSEIKVIESADVTKPDVRFLEKVEDLIGKLNGIVVKTPLAEPKVTVTTAENQESTGNEGTEAVPVVASKTETTAMGSQGQQQQSPDSEQENPQQEMLVYNPDTAAGKKDAGGTEKSTTVLEKATAPIETLNAASVKTTQQSPVQVTQNPQAFQDTLDAIQEGVQAKGQFQSRIMEQIIESVKTNFRSDDGKSEMIMKLKPESLGNVGLKVSIEKGIVLAEFQVDSQTVKQALEANLQDLRTALQDKGFNVFDLDVSVRKDNQQSQNQSSTKGNRGKVARLEGSLELIEQKLQSLESIQRQSTFDYLG